MGPVTAVVNQCKYYDFRYGGHAISDHVYEVERGDGNLDQVMQSAQEVDKQLALSFLEAYNYDRCECCEEIWKLAAP